MKRKKRYNIILADPPWTYKAWTGKSSRTADSHYSIMDLGDVANLPVRDHISRHAALFLWTTWPCIQQAMFIIKSWGFRYVTLAWEWVKLTKWPCHPLEVDRYTETGNALVLHEKELYKLAFGMGHYTRAATEPCLLAIRGSMAVSNKSIRNVQFAPIRKHSQKPDFQYELIEKLYPRPGHRYLELFARQQRGGWDCWGDDVEGNVKF